MKRLVLLVTLIVLFQSVPAFSASKSNCPSKVLSSGSVEGIYQGTECGDQCYSKIRLDNGEIFELICGEDDADKFFGAEPGGRVKASYDLQQFWNEFNAGDGFCIRAEVCKSGSILVAANGGVEKKTLSDAKASSPAPKRILSAVAGIQNTYFAAFPQQDGFAPIGQAFNRFFDKPVWEETTINNAFNLPVIEGQPIDPAVWAVNFKGIAQIDGKNARFVFTFFGLNREILINEGGSFEAFLQVNGVKVSNNVFADVLGAIYLSQ